MAAMLVRTPVEVDSTGRVFQLLP